MSITTQSAVKNWVITPAPASPFGVPPANIQQQQWMLVLSGVTILFNNGTQGIQGTLPDDWTRETVTISQDLQAPLKFVAQEFPIPAPAGGFSSYALSVSQWAPYAAISSAFHQGTEDAGFAVDTWRPHPFNQGAFRRNRRGAERHIRGDRRRYCRPQQPGLDLPDQLPGHAHRTASLQSRNSIRPRSRRPA